MIDLDSMINANAPPSFQRVFQQLSKQHFNGAFDNWKVYGWLPEFYINHIKRVTVLYSNGIKHVRVYTEIWRKPYTFICSEKSGAGFDLIEDMCERLNKEIAVYKLLYDV